MGNQRKEDLDRLRRQWARALESIAREVGSNSDVYKIMGTVAWGRYDGEPAASGDGLTHIAMGYGFLMGVRYATLNAARHFDLNGEKQLARIYDRFSGR